jgi:CheY-like chemotaxis protein
VSTSGRRGSVLLVDDDEDARGMYGEFLTLVGYPTTTAAGNGHDPCANVDTSRRGLTGLQLEGV